MPPLARRLMLPDFPIGTPGQTLQVLSDGTIGWVNASGAGSVPTGWTDVSLVPGVDKTGGSDSTAGIQSAGAAAAAAGGGVLYFPPGIYNYTSLDFDQYLGVSLLAPYVDGQLNTPVSWLRCTASGSGFGITFNSAINYVVNSLGFEYNNSGFTGYQLGLDGGPHAADCQCWAFNNCAFRSNTGGPISAASNIRLNKAIIGEFNRCHFSGANYNLQYGDAGGSYVVSVTARGCKFNTPQTGHVFLGTADGENIVFRDDCVFEGSYVTFYAPYTARDGQQGRLYGFICADCWMGDGTTQNIFDGLFSQEMCMIQNNRQAGTSGIHYNLGGSWTIVGNSIENGTVYSQGPGGLVLTELGNTYINIGQKFDSTFVSPAGYPGSYATLGNSHAAGAIPEGRWTNMVGSKFGITGPSGAAGATNDDGDLVLAAQSAQGYQPTTIGAPQSPIASAVVGGGTFAAGPYFWEITALTALGETTPSSEVTATIALNGSAQLGWLPVAGATNGYKVYRSTVTGGENTSPALVATVTAPYSLSGGRIQFTDTGTAVTAGATPATNTANSNIAAITSGKTPNPGGLRGLLLQAPYDGTHSRIAFGVGATPSTILELAEGPAAGVFGVTPAARTAAWTLNSGAVSRNLASGATLTNVEQCLRQLIEDLQAYGWEQ